jgi:transcription-repair coupling factor (superfamily II helicase)
MMWKERLKNWITAPDGIPGDRLGITAETVPLLLLRSSTHLKTPILAVFPDSSEAERCAADAISWACLLELDRQILHLPESLRTGNLYMPGNEAARARVLHRSLTGGPVIITVGANAALAKTPEPEKIKSSELLLETGDHPGFNNLLERLVKMDYDDEFEVTAPGEFSRRGGIIDVWSPDSDFPVRIEFWDDQIDSMRRFNPRDQRSIGIVNEYRLICRSSLDFDESGCNFLDCATEIDATIVIIDPVKLEVYLDKYSTMENKALLSDFFEKSAKKLIRYFETPPSIASSESMLPDCFPSAEHLRNSLPKEILEMGLEVLRKLTADQLRQWLNTGYQAVLTGKDETSCRHIKAWCDEHDFMQDTITIDHAELPGGLIFPSMKLVFMTERELFTADLFKKKSALIAEKTEPAEPPPATTTDEAAFYADLEEGDYAVHLLHGIGIYRGIREISTRGVTREVIVLEYRDNALLYVPVWQAGVINRYVGSRKGSVKIDKLGGRRWKNIKIEAARSIRDFALDMLRMQALRDSTAGTRFTEDSLEQRYFEDSFPYEDTADQTRCTTEIKQDMTSDTPMDRLLCGDVGFGKTEVAIRVAFKAVSAGKQVAILVPTTILAQQHFYTFMERFAEYPYVIDSLSRFKKPAEQRDIVSRLASGGIDIIIGTHRLLQRDISFQDLGLIVIDEEQRFGVQHKERLKRFRSTVDILTMTATPIPRTLYMAMSGLRDLSTITIAPNFRLPVKTIVTYADEALTIKAINDEVSRGGQVFYLHNRVKSIEKTTSRLRELLPNASFAVGHGQMPAEELEDIMSHFLVGKVDVLVCTTIIESGVDIPNANTIIIDRADRFGLAELYQLRGRVGRWNRQAFAYLMLPKDNIMTEDAHKRISAIRRYTHLGAGFKLAMRDLEIRGAGNLIGSEQSGHINNIGFELYCQLLKNTVAELQGNKEEFLPGIDLNIDFIAFAHDAPEDKLPAALPPEYIPSERLRLEAYRRMASFTSVEQLDDFGDELEDRYGSLPPQAKTILKVISIKIYAARAGYEAVNIVNEQVIFQSGNGFFRASDGRPPKLNLRNPLKKRLEELLLLASKLS